MTESWVVAIEYNIIEFTLNRKEFRNVRSFFMGWKLMIKGILKPNTMLPFTALPCKYKTRIEQIATERNPSPGDADKLTKAGSRKVKSGFPPEKTVVPSI